ncbi:MAG: hypothetical protein QOK42_842 [Frankiaceae bacterium]|jgi:hypothetical protein|nr:hypothetical protein [Frankiaceae bacterium]
MQVLRLTPVLLFSLAVIWLGHYVAYRSSLNDLLIDLAALGRRPPEEPPFAPGQEQRWAHAVGWVLIAIGLGMGGLFAWGVLKTLGR